MMKEPWRIGDELSIREAKGSLRGLRIAKITREGAHSANEFDEPLESVRSRSRET